MSAEMADEISLEGFVSLLLRHRRRIIVLGFAGAVAGAAWGLLTTRVYVSAATFIPQSSQQSLSGGLALAASQFGIQIPKQGDVWGPAVYMELLRSRDLLEPMALDSVTVVEDGGRRVALIDLLDKVPRDLPMPERTEKAVIALRKLIDASENKRVAGIDLNVTTRWASVSFAVAEKLVTGVNQFNLVVRKSQAAEERQFVETQAAAAAKALRQAEDSLQAFQQRNRQAASPNLKFEEDRLQRQLTLQQRIFTTLMQNREEARIREVRDTPVITVLKAPNLPATSRGRRTAVKTMMGGVTGGLVAILLIVIGDLVASARRSPRAETRELISLLQEATPRFLQRGRRG